MVFLSLEELTMKHTKKTERKIYPSGTLITWEYKGIPEQFCGPNQHIRVGYDHEKISSKGYKGCFTGLIIEDNTNTN